MLGPNEFNDYNDKIGLISQEVEPYEFLTVNDSKRIISVPEDRTFYKTNNKTSMPQSSIFL